MLKVSNITQHYGSELILKDVSFVLNPGERVGLIGPNGCGKTTLQRIIAGQLAPDAGGVQFTPPEVRVGFLEQGFAHRGAQTVAQFLQMGEEALAEAEAQVAALAETLFTREPEPRALEAYSEALARLEALAAIAPAEHEAAAVLAGLGLAHVSLDTPLEILSGGQKTRLGLARLLLHRPEIVLLDEPTNHLDIEALEWLEAWLRAYAGAALLVSHDRAFLDHTVTRILDLDPETHTLTEYVGNYSAYLETWERQREKQLAQWRDEQAEIRRIQGDIHRTAMQALSVELTTKPHDFTIRRYAKKVAQKAKSRERKLERYMESDERVEKPKLTWRMKLEFTEAPTSGREVLVLENLAAGYGGIPLFRNVDAILGAGERVALIGPNGAGKTTLLKVIMGQLAPLEGRARLGTHVQVGYYAQEQETLDPDSTPFEVVRAVAALSDTDVRSFLHYYLFSGDDVFIPVRALSYGERARLTLARMVAMGCNFLLLDEPINHLDIPSRTQFERAMTAFEGTVLAVVHDRYFIHAFATGLWALQGGALRQFVDLEDFNRAGRGAP
ncbi:MAG TPA: ABC-F family ATP-binding cassette domain-containing protein [Anaerolineae bacterium]|nr:ABC-F family ATP-binding cassette domain-containing protein [Anaerolineae bacterium]HQM13398.1 ABC-F family ATP-binding cassette domain-containing protein [Anaerolineae bacterium]